ncbi:MAG TPA: hypothetical protein VMR66_07420 [Gemmatimonadota bacterium]|nr:hypothetical protein [Gemmatimonadota bacterium]
MHGIEVGAGVWAAWAAALLVGLRHATDPDHLTAVATLVLAEERQGTRRAGRLGLAWGAGHATTLLALGIPAVLLGHMLPPGVQAGAEIAVGALIVALAARLLVRWRRGAFHLHPHRHGGRIHAHPHAHEPGHGGGEVVPAHDHPHEAAMGRSPLASFGVGLVHGVGGSAAAGVLVVAAVPGARAALVALLVFAAGTAVSMAAVSAVLGRILVARPAARHLEAAVPVVGVLGAAFGVWYAASAGAALAGAL